jgi:hypothetical protein
VPRIITLDEFLSLRGLSRAQLAPLLGLSDRELATRLPEDEASCHRDETLFVELPLPDDASGNPSTDVANAPLELWTSLGSTGDAEVASLGRKNGLHVFHRLPSVATPDATSSPWPPRLLIAVGTRERALPEFGDVFSSIESLATRFRGWEIVEETIDFNRDTLLGAIRSGVDGIVFVAHGFRNEAGDAELNFEDPTVGLGELQAALRENPRPLRFFFLMACNLFDPARRMLASLAGEGRLHPHFGAVLVRGAPEMSSGAHFTLATLDALARIGEHQSWIKGEQRALARTAPLAFAVQQGRRAVQVHRQQDPKEAWAVEAARPRLVHMHPFSRPLPLGLEQQREQYLRSLALNLDSESYLHALEAQADAWQSDA